MNIWQFQNTLARRLLIWNAINILTGAVIMLRGGFWRGFGSQHVGWGLINIAIGLFGRWSSRRRAESADAFTPYTLAKEGRNLRRLLWLNAGLDGAYMLAGWLTARQSRPDDRLRRGIGWGIVLQGGLLLIFDLLHAPQVPVEPFADQPSSVWPPEQERSLASTERLPERRA